jgi:hypothetical protein
VFAITQSFAEWFLMKYNIRLVVNVKVDEMAIKMIVQLRVRVSLIYMR